MSHNKTKQTFSYKVKSIRARRQVLFILHPNERLESLFIASKLPGIWNKVDVVPHPPELNEQNVIQALEAGRPWQAFVVNRRVCLWPTADKTYDFLITIGVD